jgi:hypothetical protein
MALKWIEFVKSIHTEGKKNNKSYSLKDAMKEASSRKDEWKKGSPSASASSEKVKKEKKAKKTKSKKSEESASESEEEEEEEKEEKEERGVRGLGTQVPVNAGFSETIVPNQNVSTGLGPKRPNMKLCPQIFDIGKKVNNKFFIPSQFPNLTKKKSLLKGGRKHMKTKGRSRRSNRINISRKGISRKGLIRNKRKSVKNLALYSNLNRHKLM